MNETNRLKIAVIAGASRALTYKQQNPRITDDEVLRHVTRETKNILEKIGDEE